MAYGLARRELRPRVPLRHGEGDKYHLTSIEGSPRSPWTR